MEEINCPDCGSKNLKTLESRGETICVHCGLVVDDSPIDQDQYSEQHKPTGSLGIAGTGMLDGKIVKSSWLLSNKEKNFIRAQNIIQSRVIDLNLPEYIQKNAEHIYAETIDKKLAQGRTIRSIAIASIYIACLKNNLPKTIHEIIKGTETTMREFNNSLKAIKREFHIELENVSVVDLLEMYMNRLNFNFKAREYAIKLYEKLKDTPAVQGKDPRSVVSAIIYISNVKNNLGIYQWKIAHETGVYETTIRRRFKDISNMIEVVNFK